MCKLIRTNSRVLSLVREVEYVNEVARLAGEPTEEKDDRRVRIMMMAESR